MSLPFIVEPSYKEIIKHNTTTDIFILRNILTTEEADTLRKVIENGPRSREGKVELGDGKEWTQNVSATFFSLAQVNDKEQYNIIKNCLSKISKHVKDMTDLEAYNPNDGSVLLRKIYDATKIHCDGIVHNPSNPCFENNVRVFSTIIALNSNYEGGELCFPNQGVEIKLEAGDAILFPPYRTHLHYTNRLNGTFRYTINTWLCE
jgi:predicted 2-oxoglutarate/Fe(II)-dependent dioxygenase YbiX